METTLRALSSVKAALGPGVMGHARAQGVLRHQLATQDVDAHFASLPAAGPLARAAMRGVPYLEATDLDLHTVRWHLAQGVRARRVIDRELARGGPFDVLHVHSHTISFLSHAHMRRIPTLLSLDATVWQWHEMGIWRDVRPYSKAVVAPSLALEKRALESASGGAGVLDVVLPRRGAARAAGARDRPPPGDRPGRVPALAQEPAPGGRACCSSAAASQRRAARSCWTRSAR